MHTQRVIQTQLDNGLTVLACPKKDSSVVSIQLWYNVGSKHEKNGERGIAHFIEHMIFKGTDTLTESDINLITNKLSGVCNAFTWYDYTGYLFDIPVANWQSVLPIMADCMEHCTFKQEHLNSEVKAVIQELKMGKDNYSRHLREEMISTIFDAHPYHYSTIGFKQDLWSVTRETLLAFYKKHYTPDNAVMVIVGDIDPLQVHTLVEQSFSHIPRGKGWNNERFYSNNDIKTTSICLYRDVQQSSCNLAFVMPGIVTKNEFELEALTYILANGRGSRLDKLLVNDLQLVVSVAAYVYDMFDKAIFFIEFTPKKEKDIDKITQLIQDEIDNLAKFGPLLEEVQRAQRFAQIAHQEMLQDTQEQAYAIGKSFIATQDPLYPFEFGNVSSQILQEKITMLTRLYCSQVGRHEGKILVIPQTDIHRLQALQELSDKEDAQILESLQREDLVEEGSFVDTIVLENKKIIKHAIPFSVRLSNGLELLSLSNNSADIIEVQLDLAVKHYFDSDFHEGIGYLVSKLMLEGTNNYPGQLFADTAESYGMSFSCYPGSLATTMLPEDFRQGLILLTEMLTNCQFTQETFDKIKANMIIELKKFWDNPNVFAVQIARKAIYKDHPFSHMLLGSLQSLDAITLQDCIEYYHKNISPEGARISIVGNFNTLDFEKTIEDTVGKWSGFSTESLNFPVIKPIVSQEILHFINRDQIVLVFAGLSIARTDEDYDKVLLFEQILTGGVLGSMASRLFQLREQSGLFYTIGGSLLQGSCQQPGMILIKTIVSADRIIEAEQAIAQVLDTAIDTIDEEELQEAKNALINSFDALYDSYEQKASTFLFLKKYNLPFDYFEKRVETLQKITIKQVQQAVKRILSTDSLIVVKAGRI